MTIYYQLAKDGLDSPHAVWDQIAQSIHTHETRLGRAISPYNNGYRYRNSYGGQAAVAFGVQVPVSVRYRRETVISYKSYKLAGREVTDLRQNRGMWAGMEYEWVKVNNVLQIARQHLMAPIALLRWRTPIPTHDAV